MTATKAIEHIHRPAGNGQATSGSSTPVAGSPSAHPFGMRRAAAPYRVLILGEEDGRLLYLASALEQRGFICLVASHEDEATWGAEHSPFDLMLVPMDASIFDSEAIRLAASIKQERDIPIIALVFKKAIDRLDSHSSIDDFVLEPWDPTEITVRANRVLYRADGRNRENLIEWGGLTIDQDRCEVSVDGAPVLLSFREYELLRFLASNRGKVFTRDVLLNRVWGYDYYGGDRTVDVHIRRIRSKIEEKDRSFIETVRNIGYKFKGDL